MIDKRNIIPTLFRGGAVVLELGCGARKRHREAIGIDALDFDCVDIVGDVFEILDSFPEGSVGSIYSYHFFEHIKDQERLLATVARILQPGGRINVVVPHFSNPFFYSDPTHQCFFGLYSFSYYADDSIFSRQVPKYGKTPCFKLVAAKLVFKSVSPRYIRHGLKKLFQMVVNTSVWTKEFYEENLCYFVPCYEIAFILVRKDDGA